jgi:23S rRNA (adenine2503-C2)-methyltransferase
MKPPLIGHTAADLTQLVQTMGEPRFRAEQLHHWLYVRCARDFDAMTNLAKPFREKLAEQFSVGPLTIARKQVSKDGTHKYLFQLPDSNVVESVLMHFEDRDTYALCISTQVGCAVNCQFCATAKLGFTRNLTAAEIVDQYLYAQHDSGKEIRNIVFMGQGEPLLNVDNLLEAIYLLNRSAEVGIRHITVSTAGIVPGITRLAEANLQLTLAVSLHAPDDDTRSQIMPINKRWPLSELMPVLFDYGSRTGRRLTIEYILLAGVNDTPEHAHKLGQLLKSLKCNINLIPYNPIDAAFQRPKRSDVLAFQHIVSGYGKKVTVRVERGSDIDAACGQLANKALVAAV